MGDRWGPRRVLLRIVLWWSFFTAATGWAFNFLSLFLTQLLFGAGEAGCFPNITRALATWLPREERVRAQGIIWLSARWGGAFTPLVVVFLFQFVSWRVAFGIFGMVGVLWAILFFRWFRDNPADNPKVNALELELMRGTEQLLFTHYCGKRRKDGAFTVWRRTAKKRRWRSCWQLRQNCSAAAMSRRPPW